MKKYWIVVMFSSMIIIFSWLMVESTFAFFTSQDIKTNSFEMGDVKISVIQNGELIEDDTKELICSLNSTCDKDVKIKNTTLTS